MDTMQNTKGGNRSLSAGFERGSGFGSAEESLFIGRVRVEVAN